MRRKFNYKALAIALGTLSVLTSSIIGMSMSIDYSSNPKLLVTNKNAQVTIQTDLSKLKTKIGTVRHYQNNGFSGVKLKNGGFVALTGSKQATRTDMFGNIIWEFDPTAKDFAYSDFSNKKVIEVVQDETNPNVFYLLLVPENAPNQLASLDPKDPTYYDEMIGTESNKVKWQATVVQIQENIHKFSSGNWIPSISVLDHVNIDPSKMVENYPTSWKNTQSSTGDQGNGSTGDSETTSKQTTETTSNDGPSFFSKIDHPSWYVNGANEKVGDVATADKQNSSSEGLKSQSSSISGTKGMVLPWKQYITNLGNMYAKNGQVFIFGGNGSMYNDPEALSIGMFRVDFRTNNSLVQNKVVGIPYAYLLSNLQYNPQNDDSIKLTNWDKCYAPIKQDANFNYVPRLAVAGVQTNITGDLNFLYLSGAITVGQVANSQNRAWRPKSSTDSGGSTSDVIADATSKNLQSQRSLQLTGANVLTTVNSSKTNLAAERNSIDPCLLFGTAFNIDQLSGLTISSSSNSSNFENVLMDNNYFDIGSTIGNTSSSVTYYFYDQNNLKCQPNPSVTHQLSWNNQQVSENSNRLAFDSRGKKFLTPNNNPTIATTQPVYTIPTVGDTSGTNSDYKEFDFFKDGKSRLVYEYTELNRYSNADGNITPETKIVVNGASMASYSWNLPLLVDNAKNYYYPTLCYGYSLKSVGSLTKVSKNTQNGYAMQVGKSILFVSEPKFVKENNKTKIDSIQNLVYRGPSTVSIGDETTFGEAKFGGGSSKLNIDNSNKYDYKYGQITDGSVDTSIELLDIVKKTPFSFSGNTKVDESIIKSGTTQLVAGIKDLNTTVSSIAGTFKISADPYATADQTNSLVSSTLPWNQFMGLTSTSDGDNLASSWIDQNNNKSKRFALTSELLFSDFSSLKSNTDLTFQDGVKQGWFEKKETISSVKGANPIAVENANMPANAASTNTYFKKTTSTNPKMVFKSGLSNSSNPVIYGQETSNGISYVNVVQDGYKTESNVSSIQVFGNIEFKTKVTYNDLGISNYKGLFDSSFNNNTGYIEGNNEYACLVKQQYVDKLLNNPSAPSYASSLDQNNKPIDNAWYKIIAFIDNKETGINFVVYAWNPLTRSYEMAPKVINSSGFTIGSNDLINAIHPSYQESEINWIMPVAIGVPIVIILLALTIFFILKSKKDKNYAAPKSGSDIKKPQQPSPKQGPTVGSNRETKLLTSSSTSSNNSNSSNTSINNRNREVKQLTSSIDPSNKSTTN